MINLVSNKSSNVNSGVFDAFTRQQAKKAMRFHQSFPEYKETPLRELSGLAQLCGISGIYVKDESYRFGLNAFKVLGGSYCIGNYIAEKLNTDIEELSFQNITGSRVKDQLGELTFVTATDGNHGRGIAWTAERLGFKSVVYMPKGSSPERLNHIRSLGAQACITEFNYDDTVRLAAKHADEYGWVLVQDTAWDGYEKIPAWIMQGYTTMAEEVMDQLADIRPTHIFLQAGVGAMAGAITAFLKDAWEGGQKPIITIVEPDQADCIFRTAKADDGKLHSVAGDLSTIMAGLACGEPCTIGWEILSQYADYFISVADPVAAKGMRILGNPVDGDARIVSGESGAATIGAVSEILMNKGLEALKQQLNIDRNSKILCFSTEGDTDKDNYRRIVWDGL